MKIQESAKDIFRFKAVKMRDALRKNEKYCNHLNELIGKLRIEEPLELCLLGAIDAMIYDIACSLDFTKAKGKAGDWSGYPKRKEIILEVWNDNLEK
ncbi:MAG: hypothetical protein V2A53_01565 [bacterium]